MTEWSSNCTEWTLVRHRGQSDQVTYLLGLCSGWFILYLSCSCHGLRIGVRWLYYVIITELSFPFVWGLQAHLAPSGYLKLPNVSAIWFDYLAFIIFLTSTWIQHIYWSWLNSGHVCHQCISEYLSKCKFLPKLNNELPDERNSTYKERFSSLETLVLIMVSSFYLAIHFGKKKRLLFVCYFVLTVWAWHRFNTQGNVLVWVLSGRSIQTNISSKSGTKCIVVMLGSWMNFL